MRKAILYSIPFIFVGIGFFAYKYIDKSPQKRFTYTPSKTKYKQDGPALFAEYHYSIRTREGDSEPRYETGYRWDAYQKSLQRRRRNGLSRDILPWTERGPANVGGRTRSIWVDPTDPSHLTWFVGSVGGGVWKTENGGATWRPLTEQIGNLSTSSIMGSDANPDVLYMGTGEGYTSLGIAGNGIWKSTNRGETWFPLESTLNDPRFGINMRLAVNPNDENEIIVAGRFGRTRDLPDETPIAFLLKSTDGGLTWNETWNETAPIQQVIASPQSFDVLYASVRGRSILRSLDAGESWELVFNAEGLNMRRMEMAVSPTNPQFVYFAAFTTSNESKLFLSTNGGNSWNEVKGIDAQNEFGRWMGSQGWYDNTIGVHPFDENIVYVGGQGAILEITVLNDGAIVTDNVIEGKMIPVTDGYRDYNDRFETSSKGVHVDHHGLVLIPIDELTGQFYMLNANDGGVAFSPNGGETFIQTGETFNLSGQFESTTGYNTAQFYGVDKMNGADRYVGGTQDNGSWVSASNPTFTSSWRKAPSGDGFEAVWHYQDSLKILESSQYNNIFRSDDGGENWRRVSPPGDGPFITRIAGSQIDPEMVFCISRQGVVRSLNFGDSWEVLPMPREWIFSNLRSTIKSSLASNFHIWTGGGVSENNRIFVSTNGGSSYSMTSAYDSAEMGPLSGLATHPYDEQTAYALFSAADGPKILRTKDLGETWEDLSGFVTNVPESNNGFPDVAVYSLLVMPFDTNQMWVGTEIGLFESLNGGASWEYADNGLPAVSIWDMKIVNDEVVLATHGRGIWSVTIPELMDYSPPVATNLLPLLSIQENGLGGKIGGEFTLRSAYDSAFIEADVALNEQLLTQNRVQVQVDSNGRGDFILTLDGLPKDTILEANVSLLVYIEGDSLRNTQKTLVYGVDDMPRSSYQTTYDDDSNHFARLDFNIYQPDTFDSKALHSVHPYGGPYETYFAVLNFPVIISANFPELSYDEIAMIEPGEPGTVFGDFEFWDYVAIEGTRDFGDTWEVIEGYDARWSERWESNFAVNSPDVDPNLVENHVMNLTNVFAPGDTVYLRFKLWSDPFVEGWGWMIDNLKVQVNTTSRAEAPERLSFNLYPNPAQDVIHVDYSLTKTQRINLSLYDISGRRIRNLQNELRPAGEHQQTWNVSELKAGVYFLRIETNGAIETLKWVKL